MFAEKPHVQRHPDGYPSLVGDEHNGSIGKPSCLYTSKSPDEYRINLWKPPVETEVDMPQSFRVIIITVDSTTSVFNTDASLPFRLETRYTLNQNRSDILTDPLTFPPRNLYLHSLAELPYVRGSQLDRHKDCNLVSSLSSRNGNDLRMM
ncbi:hypothetical protein T265_05724 [Opisthorchis viverrini]|uniref:Uncharacterized protein n=1 Tax=Opisthorchis viverrini TaxID=6198 RepID=A0A074ZV06_OPIVI|nr:hypothetical protein T265_05724 [Opisthorchis viverrini]KER27190.1 hypothetical protein T265_05724 [Opisthorchis viverrini]